MSTLNVHTRFCIFLILLILGGCAPSFIGPTGGTIGTLNTDPCPGFTVPTADFVVNSALETSDAVLDGVCDAGGGICTIRAAVEEANSVVGTQKISIPAGVTIALTTPINITESVQIFGNNQLTSIVDGGSSTLLFNAATNNISVEFDNLTLRNGLHAAGDGGAFYMRGGTLTIRYSTFSGNQITGGGAGGAFTVDSGALTYSPVITLQCSRFVGNSATAGPGGAIYMEPSSLSISDVEFQNNTASTLGGAYSMQPGPAPTTFTIVRSLFRGNSSATGGAMYQLDGTTNLISNTFYQNSASTNGGGAIFSDNTATFGVYNNSFVDNSIGAAWGAAVRSNGGGFFNFANNIFWGNTGTNTCHMAGTITSLGTNILDDPTGCAAIASDASTDPILGALGNNGGFTQTIALPEGGIAGGYGNPTYCPTTDQRGYTRATSCDAGAFEYQ